MTSIHQYRFYGCYLLISENETAPPGRSYIGFTVNPARRIRQHNGDLSCGGARKTKLLRPWRMVCIVHGFRSHVQGLQFEWGWQHPLLFRSVRTAVMAANIKGCKLSARGRQREMRIDTNLQVLVAMLSSVPWSRMPLFVTFFDPNMYSKFTNFPSTITVRCLPSLSVLDVSPGNITIESNCYACSNSFEPFSRIISCPGCRVFIHPRCAAPAGPLLVPTDTECPGCRTTFSWTNFIRDAFIVGQLPPGEIDDDDSDTSESCASTVNISPIRKRVLEPSESDFFSNKLWPTKIVLSPIENILKHKDSDSPPSLRDRLFEKTNNRDAFKIYSFCFFFVIFLDVQNP